MRKFLSLALCALLIVALFGCYPRANDSSTSGPITKLPEMPEQEPDTELAIGGDSTWELFSALDPGFLGIDTFLIPYVGADKYKAWIAQFQSHGNPGGRDPSDLTIANAVKELGVSKNEFIEGNRGVSYTPEQIDAIYSGDQKLINRTFVNRFALLHDDKIFTPDWLASRSAGCYVMDGLTPEALVAYLKAIDYEEFRGEYLAISGNIRKMVGQNTMPLSMKEHMAPYVPAYYGIDTFVMGLLDKASLTLWMDGFLYDHASNKRGRSIEECTVVELVKEFSIKRADFEKADTQQAYTKEQLDAIFSGDQKKVNMAFVSPSALLVNGRVYTAEWLRNNDIGQYQHEGISAEMLADYLKRNSEATLGTVYSHVSSALRKMK